ncbi:hypothetical protein [Yunchengibacter salinarum]|uniref:hypothetical protein n=1 Tax=Yunchengibacter salinarum TaxID=3133399 RepID=UPI0035B58B47
MEIRSLKSMLLAATATLALAACGDSSTELATPGLEGPNPGVGGDNGGDNDSGGDNGGDNGGDDGAAGDCPTGTDPVMVGDNEHCQLSGQITDDVTLTAGNVYQLSGSVQVGVDIGADGNATDGDPAVLTIEPGVNIYGATATDLLIIARGSEIQANGAAGDPIVFTSAQDLGFGAALGLDPRPGFSGPKLEEPFTSEWGGLVINGRATLNTCDSGICEAEGEGDSGFYGGDDDTDSSGAMQFVQVRYAGNPITATDELNGIAFQGVGSGTTLNNIQVHNGADDGVEFFGGTANVKNLVITGADDDSVDWTFGWRGKIQNLIVIQNPNQESDRGFEGDNREGANDATPRSQPLVANATVIGAGTPGSDEGLQIRRGSGIRLWNAVVDNFTDACLDLDNDATFNNAGSSATDLSGGLTIESTLLGDRCGDPTNEDDGDPFSVQAFFENQPNNVIGTTSLSNRFINGQAENAVTATDPAAVDSFFDSVDYIGAVRSDDPADNWTLGWTLGLNPAPTCPTNVDGVTTRDGGNTCVLSGTITEDLRLVAGLDYLLSGPVTIGQDVGPDVNAPDPDAQSATLTIDAGVTVEAEDRTSLLVITRGSQIFANGTRNAPVTFTAIDDETRNLDTDTSLWGGLVINGRSTLNTCDSGICEADGEGDSGFYGGNDDTDDSGQLFFVRVKFAGNPITATDELNGIAFQGVGSGTEIDFLQVHNGADDGVEFFGGTANVKHLVLTGADDDSLDWTFGWRGRVQYLLVMQNPNQESDRGFEGDNREGANDATPRSQPLVANATILGAGTPGSDEGLQIRRGSAIRLWNAVVDNFTDACLDLDDEATFDNAGTSATDLSGGLTIESTLLGDRCGDPTNEDDGDPFSVRAFFENQPNNVIGTTSLQQPANGGKAFISGANEAAVTATDASAVDPFFDSTDFIGAVSADDDWTAGWTVWLDQQ